MYTPALFLLKSYVISSFDYRLIMNPLTPKSAAGKRPSRSHRPSNLSIPLPKREASVSVPHPLPAGSAPSLVQYSDLVLSKRIGSGGGGTVYKVLHRPSGKFYALKAIYGGQLLDDGDGASGKVGGEVEILRDVDHPCVVKCHGLFDCNGDVQVLLEYMDGGSLEGRRIEHEPLLSDYTRQILAGLDYLHSRKIVHGDIKPSNLLVNSKGNVKISDFGVSRILDETKEHEISSAGTTAYMSPERLNTDPAHGRCEAYAGDIWGLGVSILEVYLGKFPFAVGIQGDWTCLMYAICMSEPPEAPAYASTEFREFIACCLQNDPAKRWTAGQLLRHAFIVQNLDSGSNVPSPPPHISSD